MNQAEEKAIKKYIEIHWGEKPIRITPQNYLPPPKVLVQIGLLESLAYVTEKGGEGKIVYDHFHNPDNMPILACDPEGRQLYIIGGNYEIKKEGIVG